MVMGQLWVATSSIWNTSLPVMKIKSPWSILFLCPILAIPDSAIKWEELFISNRFLHSLRPRKPVLAGNVVPVQCPKDQLRKISTPIFIMGSVYSDSLRRLSYCFCHVLTDMDIYSLNRIALCIVLSDIVQQKSQQGRQVCVEWTAEYTKWMINKYCPHQSQHKLKVSS